MAYNDISKNFTYENGGTIDGDLALTTMAANTKIKNKASGQLYVKRSGFSNVFDKTNTYANYLKADEFGINTSGSGNGVASITYSSSGRKITQNLTTFTTPSDLATANDNLKSQAVGSITVSGRTVTYKNVNGQTLGSFQTQDNNTTYSAGTGLSLNGTTFNVTSTAGNSNLQWNAEVTLGTVGGLAIKAKLPANPITEGDVIIDGYVTGSGSFDKDGNCHITVTPNISDTPSVWYVGKTNAADKWGDDENGNPWGSTQNHPFATLGYAITQTNIHTFPGNTIQIKVLDGGSYIDSDYRAVVVNCNTYVESAASSRPSFRCSWEISFNSVSSLSLDGIDFRCSIAPSAPINGQTFFRCYGSGRLAFVHGCRMIIDNNNFGTNVWGFIILYDNVELGLDVRDSQPALYLELANAGTTIAGSYCICFSDRSAFSAMAKDSSDPNLVINAPAGTKIVGEAIRVERSNSVAQYDAANVHDGIRERFLIDWNIADDSELRQVYLHKYAYLGLRKNPAKGQALPGSSVGTIADGADYDQLDA